MKIGTLIHIYEDSTGIRVDVNMEVTNARRTMLIIHTLDKVRHQVLNAAQNAANNDLQSKKQFMGHLINRAKHMFDSKEEKNAQENLDKLLNAEEISFEIQNTMNLLTKAFNNSDDEDKKRIAKDISGMVKKIIDGA